jgi:hypothetical protein
LWVAFSLVAGLAGLAWIAGSDPGPAAATVLPPARVDVPGLAAGARDLPGLVAGARDLPWTTPASAEEASGSLDLTTVAAVAVAAVALGLQLFVVHRFRGSAHRAGLTVTASLAILVCGVLLVTGHQPQRMRSPRHESLDALLLRDRPVPVSYEPHSARRLAAMTRMAPPVGVISGLRRGSSSSSCGSPSGRVLPRGAADSTLRSLTHRVEVKS